MDYKTLAMEFSDTRRIMTNDDVMALIMEHGPPLLFRVGKQCQYSNTGYVVLVLLIVRVSGAPYQESLPTKVFGIAGMRRTRVYRRRYTREAIDDYAYGY